MSYDGSNSNLIYIGTHRIREVIAMEVVERYEDGSAEHVIKDVAYYLQQRIYVHEETGELWAFDGWGTVPRPDSSLPAWARTKANEILKAKG